MDVSSFDQVFILSIHLPITSKSCCFNSVNTYATINEKSKSGFYSKDIYLSTVYHHTIIFYSRKTMQRTFTQKLFNIIIYILFDVHLLEP